MSIFTSYYNEDKKRTTLKLHQLIMSNTWIDHKDGNIFNNRKVNLRKCTRIENGRNRSLNKNSTSGYKGVYWNNSINKWNASIKTKEKIITVGRFDTKEEAIAFAREKFGADENGMVSLISVS